MIDTKNLINEVSKLLESVGYQVEYVCPECERETDIPRCWTCDPEIGG